MKPTIEELTRVYNECSAGGWGDGPTFMVTSGAALNQMTGTTDYIVGEAYTVTPDGIALVEDIEDLP